MVTHLARVEGHVNYLIDRTERPIAHCCTQLFLVAKRIEVFSLATTAVTIPSCGCVCSKVGREGCICTKVVRGSAEAVSFLCHTCRD